MSQLLPQLASGLRTAIDEGAISAASSALPPSTSTQRTPANTRDDWIPDESDIPLLVALAACAALLALLMLTIGREVRAMSRYRWHL